MTLGLRRAVTTYFDERFRTLTGNAPFPWQRSLFAQFVTGRIPETCSLPTGVGKTSVMAIWLLALAERAREGRTGDFPRRLAYVVNRRTVVDQATTEAEQLRRATVESEALRDVRETLSMLTLPASGAPLAISTLRGEFADNAEWRSDPSRPAIIVGTVDMIGSRLLFSGYGCGFKTRPFHAGLLGQDTLLVHDEAHLEPAFQSLAVSIAAEQARCRRSAPDADARPLRVLALTATPRGREDFGLSDEDRADATLAARITARKRLLLHPVPNDREIAGTVARLAAAHTSGGGAILVYLRKLDDVDKVRGLLAREQAGRVQVLTGTLRGLERDALAKNDPVFARFMPQPPTEPASGTVYLICTSAGEVGVNISADHLVCDLTPFESMAQRFGRVNRFGRGDARVDVVHATPADAEAAVAGTGEDASREAGGDQGALYERACAKTLELFQQLPELDGGRDVSPVALGALPADSREAAFSPPPRILPVTDVLFDAWSLTTVRGRLPGRPPVADWLHGVSAWEPPQTSVAWREEVGLVTGELLADFKPADLLDDYPVKPQELLRDSTKRIAGQLLRLGEQHPNSPVWVVDDEGDVTVRTLSTVVAKDRQGKPQLDALAGVTVLLAPSAGGLSEGLLTADSATANDVADDLMSSGLKLRLRLRTEEPPDPPPGMRLVRTIELPRRAEDGSDDEDEVSYWHWYVRPRFADDDGSRASRVPQELEPHLQSAADFAAALVSRERLAVPETEANAVVTGSRGHDLGKKRFAWQRAVRNVRYPEVVLAKSGGRMSAMRLDSYRHEFGSLIDLRRAEQFAALEPDTQQLALHIIAAHHGRARPHFPVEERFDPENPDELASIIAVEVPARFGRLQRRYGRWGLAYLESLLRAADVLASAVEPPAGVRS